jgi:hypothetical protein
MPDSNAPAYPTTEHLKRGPPDPSREPERARNEKWARVFMLAPVLQETEAAGRGFAFGVKGPISVPMAVRRPGADRGSRDAWIFFCHPYAVFPGDAAFWNAPVTKGVLEARLVERTPHGLRLYDEVGAGITAERVTATYPGALGVLRARILRAGATVPYAPDLVRLELDVLQCLRLVTLCLKTRSPINALAEIDKILRKPNPRQFTAEAFDEEDRDVIRRFGSLRESGTLTEVTSRFRVSDNQFTQAADVRDGAGRQLVQKLLKEWQKFESEHGVRLEELGREISKCDADARRLALDRERARDESSEQGRVARIFSTGKQKILDRLDAELATVEARRKALEAEFDAIPGYSRVRGISDGIEAFTKLVEGVRRLATNIFDHNVSQQHVKALEDLSLQLEAPDVEFREAALAQHESRLQAVTLGSARGPSARRSTRHGGAWMRSKHGCERPRRERALHERSGRGHAGGSPLHVRPAHGLRPPLRLVRHGLRLPRGRASLDR